MIAMEQAYHSNNTSINQIPALHKTVMKHGLFRYINFDNGAGKYINATNFLKESLVLNVRFDPFNLSKEVNENAYRYRGLCDTSTIANVLNVIKEESAQLEVLRRSHAMVKENGFVFISVSFCSLDQEDSCLVHGWHRDWKYDSGILCLTTGQWFGNIRAGFDAHALDRAFRYLWQS
jgi:hypothetical protein